MGVGVDQRNFFLQRETGKQIFDPGLDWFGAVEVKRALLRAGVPGTCRQNRGSKQRHAAMFDIGHKTHIFFHWFNLC